jgi:hypothetical protein
LDQSILLAPVASLYKSMTTGSRYVLGQRADAEKELVCVASISWSVLVAMLFVGLLLEITWSTHLASRFSVSRTAAGPQDPWAPLLSEMVALPGVSSYTRSGLLLVCRCGTLC